MATQIGVISYGADRPTSGITRYTQEMIAAFDRRGTALTVLHAGSGESGNGHVRLRGASRIPGLLTLGQIEIAWNSRRQDLALVHDPTGIVPLLATPSKRVSTIHDLVSYIYPEASTLINRLIARYWLPLAVRRLDGIITDSQQSKQDIVRFLRVCPDRVKVVPLGVDQRFHPVSPENAAPVLQRYGIASPYVLYVSAVQPRKKRKNLPRLLEAFARLLEWSDDWILVVAGSVDRDYRPVFEVVERLGLQPYLHFTGFVPDEHLPALYSGADLFALPSLYEGFGLPVLEAMACGTPVVTSNVSSLPEVAGDAAILVDPYSVEEIADAMRRVLSNVNLAAELRCKGLSRARQFSWERTVLDTIAVYEQILGHEVS